MAKRKKKTRPRRRIRTIIERYGLGRRIRHTDCLTYPYHSEVLSCRYRYRMGHNLFCVRSAERLDSRLLS